MLRRHAPKLNTDIDACCATPAAPRDAGGQDA